MGYNLSALFRNSLEVYEYLCKPVCESAGITQGELTVLLFLANNPDKTTAMDIHKNAGIKQSLLSILVEKLVEKGFLIREAIPGNRRSIKLVLTDKAQPVIQAGREVQDHMRQLFTEGVSKEDLEAYARVVAITEKNIFVCREKMLRGEPM